MATQAECAAHLVMSERRFRELIDDGLFTRADKGAYDLDDVRRAYIEHLRSVASGRGGGEAQANKADEEARRMRALAEIAELKSAEMSNSLIPADQVAASIHEAVTVMKTSLLAIPAKAAARVGAKDVRRAEQVIKDEVAEALEALSRIKVVGNSRDA